MLSHKMYAYDHSKPRVWNNCLGLFVLDAGRSVDVRDTSYAM